MRVIIAGGGIVGLTTAVALRAAGAEVLVSERAPEIRAVGASIGLWRNALDVFARIGVGDGVEALSTPVSTWFHDAAGTRHRAPGSTEADHAFALVPRAELNRLLADAVGPGSVRLGSRVTGFVEDGDGVTVRFADGGDERADLLVGADGVHSRVRDVLLPGFGAREHRGHHAWRGTLPSIGEPAGGSVLTVGRDRSRGGYTRTHGGATMWMVNQFDVPPLTGTPKEQALERAALLSENGWNSALAELIAATPEEAVLHHQILFVPPLPRWTSDRVALIGDAAHGLSPHIAAGGTLGVEDVGVLARALAREPDTARALRSYESDRRPRYATVREHARAVEHAADAPAYARHYAAFSHWMLAPRPPL
ncbi:MULTISPECIES: FAD-dependent oxidoreductase [Streptomyces]|uniref:FAD-dependent monooxygenase n=1 Tax=Streptomyces doudnae TaxID=3075536 RepID=A0ABD5EGT5_9ACTN|nr:MULTISPECIES: FAD-dependent monooxygenase [unclassified Streptomyces]MDT0433877.1 FAD-dependent monooxygenase [Streptomyces sp. DSM 41981]MYQ64691.1 oxidoreductase [Streptomyces sp. SID4950]SCD84238.1 2-polyprenyl-6-methoxyphenol hydroxylase [Streptomyces sp. SolWspMP-5a-2]